MSTIDINYTEEPENFDPSEERERRIHLLEKRHSELLNEMLKIATDLQKLENERRRSK